MAESIRQKFKRLGAIVRNVVRTNKKSPNASTAAIQGSVSELFADDEDLVEWFASDTFSRGRGKAHLSTWGIELLWRSKKETFGESTVSVQPSAEVVLDARAKSVYLFDDSPLPPIDGSALPWIFGLPSSGAARRRECRQQRTLRDDHSG